MAHDPSDRIQTRELIARLSGPMYDLLSWWVQARTQRRGTGEDASDSADAPMLPARSQLDPSTFPKALPAIWLCDWSPEQRSARMRLNGEHIAQLFDQPLKGRWLEEIASQRTKPHILEIYRRVAEMPCLYHADGAIYRLSRELSGEGQRMILPLADDGRRVTHLLGITEYGLSGRGPRTADRVDMGHPGSVREHFLAISEVADALA